MDREGRKEGGKEGRGKKKEDRVRRGVIFYLDMATHTKDGFLFHVRPLKKATVMPFIRNVRCGRPGST